MNRLEWQMPDFSEEMPDFLQRMPDFSGEMPDSQNMFAQLFEGMPDYVEECPTFRRNAQLKRPKHYVF